MSTACLKSTLSPFAQRVHNSITIGSEPQTHPTGYLALARAPPFRKCKPQPRLLVLVPASAGF